MNFDGFDPLITKKKIIECCSFFGACCRWCCHFYTAALPLCSIPALTCPSIFKPRLSPLPTPRAVTRKFRKFIAPLRFSFFFPSYVLKLSFYPVLLRIRSEIIVNDARKNISVVVVTAFPDHVLFALQVQSTIDSMRKADFFISWKMTHPNLHTKLHKSMLNCQFVC